MGLHCRFLVEIRRMESTDQLFKNILGDYLKFEFSKILPELISKSIKKNPAFIWKFRLS